MYQLYFHIDPDSKEVVYVGIGKYDRPWQINNRSVEHKKWLKWQMDNLSFLDDIVYVDSCFSKKETALESELEYIDRVRPRFNKNYSNPTVVLTEEGLKKAKEYRDQGLSYSQIAQNLETSTMTIWRAINGHTKAHN